MRASIPALLDSGFPSANKYTQDIHVRSSPPDVLLRCSAPDSGHARSHIAAPPLEHATMDSYDAEFRKRDTLQLLKRRWPGEVSTDSYDEVREPQREFAG